MYTNPEGLSLPNVWTPAFVNSGISNYTYIPPSTPVAQTDWPTLGTLISAQTRVIVFLDAGADGTDGTVDYILPEFQMVRLPAHSFTRRSPLATHRYGKLHSH